MQHSDLLEKIIMRYVKVVSLLAGASLLLATGGRSLAAVESDTLLTLQSSGKPVDTALSADGKLFFVLTAQKTVEIYDANGQLKDTLQLDVPADRLAVSGEGDTLYLTDSASGAIRMVGVSFVQEIQVKGSPFKGPVSAPVVVAIFSDFQ